MASKSITEQLRAEEERIKKSKLKMAALKKKQEKDALKLLEHNKFSRGGLLHIAGLLYINPNVTLGALIDVILPVVHENQEEIINRWEQLGKHYHEQYAYKGRDRADIQKSNELKTQDAIERNPVLKDRMVR